MLDSLAWNDDPDYSGRQEDDSGSRLFINVNTGRFLWKDIPQLVDHYNWVAADASGLVILRDVTSNDMLCVLNPFTGRLVRFAMSWPNAGRTLLASKSMVLYAFFNARNGHWGARFDPTRDSHCWKPTLAEPAIDEFATMVAFQGCAYGADNKGSVVAIGERGTRKLGRGTRVRNHHLGQLEMNHRTFLVDNDGVLLLVRIRTSEGGVQAFRVDLESKALEEIKFIGKRAIFLGKRRSLSVHADDLDAVEGNCVYYVGGAEPGNSGICVHRLVDGSNEKLFKYVEIPGSIFVEVECRARPWSLAQVLLDYANYI
jgi:hypothetical protein